MMKAAITTGYGSPDVIRLKEVPKPVPAKDEVLIKVHATTVTSGDARVRANNVPKGFGMITRLAFGFTKPRNPVFGMEFSGVIESIGEDVTTFKKGDSVFGVTSFGANAEYLTIGEEEPVLLKPASLSFEEAASIPFGALSSLVYLRDFGNIKAGQKLLVYGASGSLGTAAVQLGKYFGAEVTAICSTSNVAWVEKLGADEVIDYKKENFMDRSVSYDLIFDTVGKIYYSDCIKVLKPNGKFLMAVAGIPQFLLVFWTSLVSKKKAVAGVATFEKEDLQVISNLLQAGKYQPVIDQIFPLSEIVQAHAHVDRGHKKGNVVVKIV